MRRGVTGSVRIGPMRTDAAVGNATDSRNGHSSPSEQANTVIGTGIQADAIRKGFDAAGPAARWRRYGFGGPPEPWERGAQRDLDRLSTSYFVDILASRRIIMAAGPDEATRGRIEELFTTAERHKHEIEFTLRHWATPVERARVEDRLGSLMRIGMRLRELRDSADPEPLPAA